MPRKRRVSSVTASSETKLRVHGYTRVSTEEQGVSGVSMPMQAEKIRAYCSLYQLDLITVISDPGQSAKSLDREGVQVLLRALDRGEVDGVVIYKLDRLTRSLRDWSHLIDRYFCERAGRRLFSVSDSIDTRTPSGRMVLNMMMTVAQWEREEIGYRTSAALQGKIGRRERCGKVRYGYQLDPSQLHPKTGKPYRLIPDECEQEVIRMINGWFKQGKTYREIVDLLAELGVPTKSGGFHWQHCTIRQIMLRSIA